VFTLSTQNKNRNLYLSSEIGKGKKTEGCEAWKKRSSEEGKEGLGGDQVAGRNVTKLLVEERSTSARKKTEKAKDLREERRIRKAGGNDKGGRMQ